MPDINQSHIQSFLDYLKFQKRYSLHTIRSYGDDLTQFFDYLELHYGQVSPEKINHGHSILKRSGDARVIFVHSYFVSNVELPAGINPFEYSNSKYSNPQKY